jgi:hypothetical protein
MNTNKKTLQEWTDELGIIILDPDGFDRFDQKLYEKEMSFEEFTNGILRCTIDVKGENRNTTNFVENLKLLKNKYEAK